MKITTVTYQKTYSIGPYLTDRIGLEASLDEGESVADILDNLRAKADEWHKAEHPHLYQETKTEMLTHEVKGGNPGIIQVDNLPPADYATAIQSAKTLEELKSFKLIAANDKTLYNAYNQRIKELTQ
jgi:hypothetical protein